MTEASDNDDLFGSDVSSEGGKAEPMNVSPSKQQDTNSTTDVLDLFGEESDGDEAVTRRAVVVQEEDEEDMEDGQAADEDEFGGDAMDVEDEPKDEVVVEATIGNPGGPEHGNPNVFLAKMPFFIGYEPKPFSKESFQPGEAEGGDDQLQGENTIRWRFNPMNPTQKESNTRMVRWSDGSFSLLIGEELFEVATVNIQDAHQYLLLSHENEGLFQTQAKFSKSVSFRPHSTQSAIHKKLTKVIASKHRKLDKTKNFVTKEDPEKIKAEAERIDNEKYKAKKRLEAKKRSAYESQFLDAEGLEYESGEETAYRRGTSSMLERLDNYAVDDFVVEDEEDSEEEEQGRKARLMAAKKGNRRSSDSEESGEEMSEEEEAIATDDGASDGESGGKASSGTEKVPIKTKRLRIEESDEDED